MASLRFVARRHVFPQIHVTRRLLIPANVRSFSKSPVRLGNPSQNPSQKVVGVTEEDLENDPKLAAFFAANFPEEEDEVISDEEVTELDSSTDETDDTESEASELNIRSLFCYKRDAEEEEGSNRCRRLRAQRFIPGLLYGGDPNLDIISKDPSSKTFVKTRWNQLHRELDRYHRHFESRVYDLTVFEDPEDEVGSVHRVLPRDVQRHPVQNKLYCVNYLRYFPGRPIKIPIVYINEEESPALKRDGFIVPVNKFVECVVEDGVPIPEHLELECTDLRRKDVIRMSRIIFPGGVKPSWRLKDPDQYLIGTVFGRSSADVAEEEAEEEAERENKEVG